MKPVLRLQQPIALLYTVSIMMGNYVKTALFFFIYSSDFGCTIGSDVYARLSLFSHSNLLNLPCWQQLMPLNNYRKYG